MLTVNAAPERLFGPGICWSVWDRSLGRLDNWGSVSMATLVTTPPVVRKPLYTSLFAQVLVALLLGIVLGVIVPDFAVSLKILSDAFLKLITMIVAPIVFCVVVHGIAAPAISRRSGGSASRRWSTSRS
jgi:hypothetical protein